MPTTKLGEEREAKNDAKFSTIQTNLSMVESYAKWRVMLCLLLSFVQIRMGNIYNLLEKIDVKVPLFTINNPNLRFENPMVSDKIRD